MNTEMLGRVKLSKSQNYNRRSIVVSWCYDLWGFYDLPLDLNN